MRLLESIRVIKTVVNNTPVLGTVARVASKATRAIVKPNKSLSQKEPRTDPDGKVIENRSFTYARKFKDIVFKTKSRAVLIIGGTLLVGYSGIPETHSNTLRIGQKILICLDSTDRQMENMGW